MAVLFREWPHVSIFELVKPFGVLWIVSLMFLIVAVVLLSRWVFGYLLKQFQAQIFMVYTTTILAVFLVTTVSFTGLLLRNMETEALKQIETDVKVLDFAVQSQKDQSIADAQSLAVDPRIKEAIVKNDRKTLGDIATAQLVAKKLYTFLIVSENGQVLARGEDRDRVGDSLSSDALLKRAVFGDSVATTVATEGVVSPELSIRSASPVRGDGQEIIGVVYIGRSIDSAFVDGMKKATGLDASIYGDNIVSATTFMSQDGRNRMTGMKEDHDRVKQTVLSKGQLYSGSLMINGVLYTSAFSPMKNIDNNPVGMLFVGRPQSAILQAAGASIQYTFVITAFLMVVSIVPAYMVARYIAGQL
jgi:sensor histidine kinase regulating citrate/malate metabolism